MRNDGGHAAQAVLELTVANHPGVMAHVCGLFSRRAFNVDGILCLPVGNGRESRIWLRVREGERLAQVESQLCKLHDVRAVRRHPPGHAVFAKLELFFREQETGGRSAPVTAGGDGLRATRHAGRWLRM